MAIQNSFQIMQTLYTESKFWLTFGGLLWAAFKGVDWIKSIKTNDLHHIQSGVDDIRTGLREQTTAIVSELKELRQDVRTSMMVMQK